MTSTNANIINRRDLDFLLFEWLKVDEVLNRPIFAEHSSETIVSVLDVAERIATDRYLPHYKKSDQEEPRLTAEGVRVLPDIREALHESAEAGLFAASFATDLGGLQLPHVVFAACEALLMSANIATAAYLMLTVANARLLARYGTAEQIKLYARPQIEGRTLGTMCLSEPQAGSSLADIRTRAEHDGANVIGKRYRLFGNKMWISGGDHDITENIIHLVLAKVPGPDGKVMSGSKNISLFVVPKLLANAEVAPVKNDIAVAGLNHKMAIAGPPTVFSISGRAGTSRTANQGPSAI